VLAQRGGRGGELEWEFDFWLWPLPPPGSFAFVVEWPSEQIELSRHEVDASLFIEASGRSELLWPEERGAGGSAWTSYGLVANTQHPRSDPGNTSSGLSESS